MRENICNAWAFVGLPWHIKVDFTNSSIQKHLENKGSDDGLASNAKFVNWLLTVRLHCVQRSSKRSFWKYDVTVEG